MNIDFICCPPFYAELNAYESKREVLFFGLKKVGDLHPITIESGGDLRTVRGLLECRKRVDEDESGKVGELVYLGAHADPETGKENEHYSVGLNVGKDQFDKLFHCARIGIVPRVRIGFPWTIKDNESFGIRYGDIGSAGDMKWYNVNQPTVEISSYSFTLHFDATNSRVVGD
jgi:hypothetical protein